METIQKLLKANKNFIVLVAVLTGLLFVSYSNHFHNPFEFDDFHTIVHNNYIQDLSNIPKFFTDNSTMSTSVGNRSYRPVVALLNAIDYSIDGLNPYWFHVSIFISYLVLLFFLFLFIKGLFDASNPNEMNKYFALFGTAFFALHASNAETINYIIARSDSFSTLCIVLTMFFYQNESLRKKYLYFIPMIVGIYTKQVGVVVIPILFFYILFYEEGMSIKDMFFLKNKQGLINSIKKIAPIAILGIAIFALNQFVLTKGQSANLLQEHRVSRLHYFTTQWYVIAHYIGNFILPINLSADPDIKVINDFLDPRKILGLVIIAWMLRIAYITSLTKEQRPISFGILWFFISLVPTSTFHPLNQVSNDHRVFLPYIGLVISLTYYLAFQFTKLMDKSINKMMIKGVSLGLIGAILISHAYGTYQRNIVWSSSSLLWKDVAEKSPENGRGLMNYGLTLMAKGDYEGTLVLFERAIELMPYYSYIHINMGILKNAMRDSKGAEKYYLNALRYDRTNPEAYYYYAKFLLSQNRKEEALFQVESGLKESPGHTILMGLHEKIKSPEFQQSSTAEDLILKLGTSTKSGELIDISLAFYKRGQYDLCIQACNKVLQLDPKSALAYNNLCIANIRLGKIDEAINAGETAVKLAPNFTLAKNNLNWAKSLKTK